VHDFVIPELGRVSPYGVYDLAANAGWVSVGIDHDTAAFAVATIRRWWLGPGRTRYPDARQVPDPTIHDCSLAVEEALTNIARHAYGGNGEGEIRIEL